MKKNTNSYETFAPKSDVALVRVLSKEIINAEDDLVDFDIKTKNPTFSQNHVLREKTRIRVERTRTVLETA
jgi:hypothetical protein